MTLLSQARRDRLETCGMPCKSPSRQRALPQTDARPPAQRRLSKVCAPGYLGPKRGEVVRTRTTVLQAHPHQWADMFSGPGNDDYQGELKRAVQVCRSEGFAQPIPMNKSKASSNRMTGPSPLFSSSRGI